MILKRKTRYILVEASGDIDLEARRTGFEEELLDFLGEFAYSYANPRAIRQYNKRVFSLRVNRGFEAQVILSLSFLRGEDRKMGFYTIKTSGTLKTLADYVKDHMA